VEGVLVRGPWKAPQEEPQPDDTIDVDMPFSAREVARATSAKYVEHLTRSDVPVVVVEPKPSAQFCSLGERNCKKFEKNGVCKSGECPLAAAETKKRGQVTDLTPFVSDPIDVDMPFSAREVAAATCPAYVGALGRSDMAVAGRWTEAAVAAKGAGRVLVVDDEAVVANSLQKIFSRKGYSVDEAFSCREALAKVAESSYDMVLLDVRMPDGNGLALLPRMKALRPSMPVVIVTGFASIDTAVEAVQKGASDYMPKPFTSEEVYALTRRVMKTAVA
jgi:ActR/RegA family two-component response regulator